MWPLGKTQQELKSRNLELQLANMTVNSRAHPVAEKEEGFNDATRWMMMHGAKHATHKHELAGREEERNGFKDA